MNMEMGRMPACDIEPLVGSHITGVPINSPLSGQNNNNYPVNQGNNCGHNALIPRIFAPPSNHKRRFPPIEKAKQNLATSYFHPLKYPFGQIFYHQDKPNKQGVFRQRRSEAREPITTRIGQVLLHYANIANMALGYIDAKTQKFISYGIAFIAEKSGASLNQTRKILKIFKKYGYIDIIPQTYKTPDGRYRAKDAIVTIDIKLYYDLEVTEEELLQYRQKQLLTGQKQQVAAKSNQYRANTYKAKKEYKAIQKELRAKTDENPGSDRKREQAPLYRDYTGISKDPQNFTKQFNGTPTAKNFLANIMDKLKPKPS